jgi:hypothetical protein
MTLSSVIVNILSKVRNLTRSFLLIDCKRQELIISALCKNKDAIVLNSLDNNAHHFSVRSEFKNFDNFILFILTVNLNFNILRIFANHFGYSRNLSGLQKLKFVLRGTRKGRLIMTGQLNLQHIMTQSDTSP